MRTRTMITAFLAVSAAAGTASAQLQLKGSDTLENVTKRVIQNCSALPAGSIVYIGGGSGAGQSAMAGFQQHVAPMSRQLNNPNCTTNSRQLLIGLDGIVVVAKNPQHTDPAGGTCSDDVGGVNNALSISGIPEHFILCTSNSNCTAFGTTCDTVRQFCVPGGTLNPCTTAQGCSPAGTYTFDNGNGAGSDDWKDVLAQIYGGQSHVAGNALVPDPTGIEKNADGTAVCQGFSAVDNLDASSNPILCSSTLACPTTGNPQMFCNLVTGHCQHQVGNGTFTRNCLRNPAKVDCSNPVRGVLLASYGSVVRTPTCSLQPAQNTCTTASDCPFNQTCTAGLCTCAANTQCAAGQTCNTGTGVCTANECVKVKHAFRRDDLSGTTDAFQALVGLQAIAGFTQQRSTLSPAAFGPEIADFAATASPFCNAGTAAMNKGFSDGLDLDPYRRACSTGPAPDRFGLENVCQAFAAPTNSDPGCYVSGGSLAALSPENYYQREKSAPQGRGFLPGGTVDTATALAADLQNNPLRPRCLGVVLPISIPTDVVGQTVWNTWRYPPASSGSCGLGTRGPSNVWAGHTTVCPDGLTIKAPAGNCPSLALNGTNFDCTIDSPLPGTPPISDARVYNLTPLDAQGHMGPTNLLQDAYANPNFTVTTGQLNNLRRFARRYYGLHMVRVDSSQSQATVATPCKLDTDTTQIGCLVKASPCSIGYAGREAADDTAPFNNVALRLTGVQATVPNIENLATGGSPVYPMARKLWFNSFMDPNIGFSTGNATGQNLTANELTLSACMGLPGLCTVDADCTGANGVPPCNSGTGRCATGVVSTIDAAIQNEGFVKVPASVQRLVLSGGNTGNGCSL